MNLRAVRSLSIKGIRRLWVAGGAVWLDRAVFPSTPNNLRSTETSRTWLSQPGVASLEQARTGPKGFQISCRSYEWLRMSARKS